MHTHLCPMQDTAKVCNANKIERIKVFFLFLFCIQQTKRYVYGCKEIIQAERFGFLRFE